MINKKSISVVIPNFNGAELLQTYLPTVYISLKSSSYISEFEVIVVDDASTDNSVHFISDNYPDIVLLHNIENLGFSKTINKGILVAKMDLVFLLNSDMALSNDVFDYLIPPFLSDEQLFGVAPTILNQTGDTVLEAQKLPVFKKNTVYYIDNLSQTQSAYSLYLCGGCALVSKDKLLKLNGFNEIYSPFYFEDFDLSLRAWMNGWKCLFVPQARIFHCHSVTIKTYFDSEKVETIFLRNRLLLNYLYASNECPFYLKNYGKYLLGKLLPSEPRNRFNAAFAQFCTLPERKKLRKEQRQQGINLKKLLENIF